MYLENEINNNLTSDLYIENNPNIMNIAINNNVQDGQAKSFNSICQTTPEYNNPYNYLRMQNDNCAFKNVDNNLFRMFQDLNYNKSYEYKYNKDENYINFDAIYDIQSKRTTNYSKYNDDVLSNKSNDLQQNIFSNDKNSDKDSCKSLSIDIKNFFV